MSTKKTVKKNTDLKSPAKPYVGEKLLDISDRGDKEMKMPTPAEYRQQRSDELLKEAARHIDQLRRANERLSIRTQAYDDFLSVFRNQPPRYADGCAGVSNDITHAIERHLNHDGF